MQQFGEGGKLQQVENADTAIWNGQYWVMQNGIIYDVSAGDGVERTMKLRNNPYRLNLLQRYSARSTQT